MTTVINTSRNTTSAPAEQIAIHATFISAANSATCAKTQRKFNVLHQLNKRTVKQQLVASGILAKTMFNSLDAADSQARG